MKIIKDCISEIDAEIKKTSKMEDYSKMSGLVVAKYILIGKLSDEEKKEVWGNSLSSDTTT